MDASYLQGSEAASCYRLPNISAHDFLPAWPQHLSCYNLILYTYFQVELSWTSYTHIPVCIYIYRHAELYSHLHISVFYLNTIISMHLSSCKLYVVYILLSSYLHTQPCPYLSMNFPTFLSFDHGTCPALWKDSTRSRAWIASYAGILRKMWGRLWR